MSRGLGLHRSGRQVAYALVERAPASAPEVLAAGQVPLEELEALYQRLTGERNLPWALAEEQDGERVRRPGADWPLRRPAARALLHPATAAALWEWECGRLLAADLFVWLRPERLLWNLGEPGVGPAGSLPRRGPLREAVDQLQRAAEAFGRPAAVAVDGDAPGAGVVEQELARAGCTPRMLRRSGEERGADRAAAGAALGAIQPARPGVFLPARTRQPEPWLWTASVLAAAAVGGATWLGTRQARALERFSGPGASTPARSSAVFAAGAPATPEELGRLLARRRAMNRALEVLLQQAPPGALEDLDLITAPGQTRAQVRMRLVPGVPGASADWLQALPPDFRLEARSFADGSTLVRGEVGGKPGGP
ncbi:MAG: hypothetical protein EYC70_14595 [Planctomycetota bacterium]|nr:MAG: hypothetical protein EYC70_14595 [Planctomycetota bacterium]